MSDAHEHDAWGALIDERCQRLVEQIAEAQSDERAQAEQYAAWAELVALIAPSLEQWTRQSSMLRRAALINEDDARELLVRVLERLSRRRFRALARYARWQAEGADPGYLAAAHGDDEVDEVLYDAGEALGEASAGGAGASGAGASVDVAGATVDVAGPSGALDTTVGPGADPTVRAGNRVASPVTPARRGSAGSGGGETDLTRRTAPFVAVQAMGREAEASVETGGDGSGGAAGGDEGAPFRRWLVGEVRRAAVEHVCYRMQRAGTPRVTGAGDPSFDSEASRPPLPDEVTVALGADDGYRTARERAERALAMLPQPQQLALYLVIVDGVDIEELATHLRESKIGALRVVQDARALLRRLLDGRPGAGGGARGRTMTLPGR